MYSFCQWLCAQLKEQDSRCKVEEESGYLEAVDHGSASHPYSFTHSSHPCLFIYSSPIHPYSVTHPFFYLLTHSLRNKSHSLSDISVGQMPY